MKRTIVLVIFTCVMILVLSACGKTPSKSELDKKTDEMSELNNEVQQEEMISDAKDEGETYDAQPVEKEIIPEIVITKDEEVAEELQPEIIKEAPIPIKAPILEEKSTSTDKKTDEEKVIQESREKSINRILWGIIVVLVLIILFGAYWMFLRPADTPEEVIPVPQAQEEVAIPAPVIEEKPQEDTLKTVQFIKLSEEELRKERVPSFADTLDYQIVGTLTEHTGADIRADNQFHLRGGQHGRSPERP